MKPTSTKSSKAKPAVAGFSRFKSKPSTVTEGPYGLLGDQVSRVRVAQTKLPAEMDADRIRQLGNLVAVDKRFARRLKKDIEEQAKLFREQFAGTITSTTLGFDQAIDWTLVMLKDALGIKGSVSNDILHLLELASNISMLERITDSLKLSDSVRKKLLDAVIENGARAVYEKIGKKGGTGTRLPADANLTAVLVDERLRELLHRRSGGVKRNR